MESFFNYEVLHNNKSLVISGNTTLEETKEKLQHDINYYIGECNYVPLQIKIEEMCNSCFNSGKIKKYNKRNKFIFKLIKCPNCLGHPPIYKEEYQVTK
jgi:hypothetical protein